jgi:hypothetical protein
MKQANLLNYLLFFILFYTSNTANALGHITIINPIATTIAAAIALSTIAHRAYQPYMQQ